MNREILFRGKVRPLAGVDGGYWVYGYLVGDSIAYPRDPNEMVYEKVIPETVGQYTGLKDKNGTKIFEGDIISFLGIKGDAWDPIDYRTTGEVYYNSASYVIKEQGSDKRFGMDGTNDHGREVIGNIHEDK